MQLPSSIKSQSYSDELLKRALLIYQRTGDATLMNKFLDKAGALTKPGVGNLIQDVATSKPVTKLVGMADDANRQVKGGQFIDDLIGKVPLGKGGAMLTKAAGSNVGRFAGRALPILGALQSVGDVGDIVFGDDSLSNKAMDTAAMGIGGTIGGVLGMGNPLLAAGGASVGKAASDGLQFLLGGGKSAEERKLEEALKLLQQRGLV